MLPVAKVDHIIRWYSSGDMLLFINLGENGSIQNYSAAFMLHLPRPHSLPPNTSLSNPLQEYFKNNILLCCERQLHLGQVMQRLAGSTIPTCINFNTGTLIFDNDTVVKNIQVLGSYSLINNTWLWSWHNPNSVPEEILEDALYAKEYGYQYGIPEFTDSNPIPMDKDSALTMAMVAVDVVGAEAYYAANIRQGEGIAFISIRDERLVLPKPGACMSGVPIFPSLVSRVLETYPQYTPDQIQLIQDYCTGRGDLLTMDMQHNPSREVIQQTGIEIENVMAIGYLKEAKGCIIAKIIYNTGANIAGIHIITRSKEDGERITRTIKYQHNIPR